MAKKLVVGMSGALGYAIASLIFTPQITSNTSVPISLALTFFGMFVVIALIEYIRLKEPSISDALKNAAFVVGPFVALTVLLKHLGLWQAELGLAGNRPFVQMAELEGVVSDEKFVGVAWAAAGTGSNVWFQSDKGISCVGRFKYKNKFNGSGVAECEDGRLGEFQFSLTSVMTGKGVGTLGDQKMQFNVRPALNSHNYVPKEALSAKR